MGNLYKALLSHKSRKFDLQIQQIVPKSAIEHNMWGLVVFSGWHAQHANRRVTRPAQRKRPAHATPVSPAFYRERRRGPLSGRRSGSGDG